MKKRLLLLVFILSGSLPTIAQDNWNINETTNMDRIELAKKNYKELFGGEALTNTGTDPELMNILQKFIFGEVFNTGSLDIKTRELITIVTLTTMQTLPQLKAHTGAALNVGATPLEIREAVYQCAPFIGFPKTLNAVGVINEVFTERGISLPLETQGTVTEENRYAKGKEIQSTLYGNGITDAMTSLPEGMNEDVPRFLTEMCFGDFYTRGTLDIKTREVLVLCVLATLDAEQQIYSHTAGNLIAGNSKETLYAAIIQTLPYIGFPAALNAINIIKTVPQTSAANNMVRLSKITVDPAQLDNYNAYLKEEIEASIQLEPGVLTLYAVSEKEHPNRITILEIYADEAAYQSHIKTPHFLKYKQGTLDMVQTLELIDTNPLIQGVKIK